jgi:hypothetical protein
MSYDCFFGGSSSGFGANKSVTIFLRLSDLKICACVADRRSDCIARHQAGVSEGMIANESGAISVGEPQVTRSNGGQTHVRIFCNQYGSCCDHL